MQVAKASLCGESCSVFCPCQRTVTNPIAVCVCVGKGEKMKTLHFSLYPKAGCYILGFRKDPSSEPPLAGEC